MAVGVEQHRDQHRRVIRRPAMPIGPIRGTEPRQIQLIDHVDHEPHQMIRRQPIPHIRRQQEQLPTIRGNEVEPHGQIFIATSRPITQARANPFMKQARTRQRRLSRVSRSPRRRSLPIVDSHSGAHQLDGLAGRI
jgi:hypothetical protein